MLTNNNLLGPSLKKHVTEVQILSKLVKFAVEEKFQIFHPLKDITLLDRSIIIGTLKSKSLKFQVLDNMVLCFQLYGKIKRQQ
jgi:hypothetical protein